jgi:UDP-glucose 4-epimerase
MKIDLVTGGCGFVGRHMVRRLLSENRSVWIVDDLSTGRHPSTWLPGANEITPDGSPVEVFETEGQTVLFSHLDAIDYFLALERSDALLQGAGVSSFGRVVHLASVVGGRAVIEGDPLSVAVDLAIDALFFRWIAKHGQLVDRVLYASSSAAYPAHLQGEEGAVALQETMISFDERLGQPDMTYGWSKLTGEYLAGIAASQYEIPIACVRPFSGYGGDQDQSYPIPAIARRVARRDDPIDVWGTGEQGRDFVHIDDCIDAMLHAMERISDGSGVNIGSGKLTTFNQIIGILSEIEGYDPTINRLLDKPVGVQSRYADITVMEDTLDWHPQISTEEGLGRVLAEQKRALAGGA